jgi:DNA-binding CsgD family transcriptional regulator
MARRGVSTVFADRVSNVAGESPGQPTRQPRISTLVDQAAGRRVTVLVIDDVHLMTDTEVAALGAVLRDMLLAEMARQGPAEQGPGDPPVLERQAGPRVPLSPSELAVLRLLPSLLTNQEIADALFLSVNTIKTHLRSIYRKLAVTSRRQAIANGRRLRLLLTVHPRRVS